MMGDWFGVREELAKKEIIVERQAEASRAREDKQSKWRQAGQARDKQRQAKTRQEVEISYE